MAERRMFALKIIDSDAFLDMPASSQSLYFHLSMRADDDGFISNPKRIMRMIGASDDDIKILLSKRFMLAFDTGIVVIKHWRLHNYIAKDRYHETIYKEEKEKLFIKENGSYTDHPEAVSVPYTTCIQNVDPGKVREGKVSEGERREEDPVKPVHPKAIALSSLLFTLHKDQDPKYNVSTTQLANWSSDIEKIARLDGRGYDDIERVLRWAKADGFWRPNIMSGKKLREKFPTLYAQMTTKRGSSKPLPVHERTTWLDMED